MGWDDLPGRRIGISEMDAENPVYRDVKGEVTVPESFVLFCNAYGLRPEDVLHDYASDLAGQGNGSDERDRAEEHFRRSHGLVVGEYPEATKQTAAKHPILQRRDA